MTYTNPRLKHVKKIKEICESRHEWNYDIDIEEILNLCNLLLETKKIEKCSDCGYFHKKNGDRDGDYCECSHPKTCKTCLKKISKETKKTKKLEKCKECGNYIGYLDSRYCPYCEKEIKPSPQPEKCEHKPNSFIPVLDVKKPVCLNCGVKLGEFEHHECKPLPQPEIEKLDLWPIVCKADKEGNLGDSTIPNALESKINELVERVNKLTKTK